MLNVTGTLHSGKSPSRGKSDTPIKLCSSKNERLFKCNIIRRTVHPYHCCSTKSPVLAAESISYALPLLRYTLPDYPYSEGIAYKLASSHPCLGAGTVRLSLTSNASHSSTNRSMMLIKCRYIQYGMDQISMKTPNPNKCRFYWCLTEFIDWRYIQ